MARNMGTADRAIRLFVAGILLYLAFGSGGAFAAGALFWLALAVALVFIVTALVGNCPLYSIFGIRTCSAKQAG